MRTRTHTWYIRSIVANTHIHKIHLINAKLFPFVFSRTENLMLQDDGMVFDAQQSVAFAIKKHVGKTEKCIQCFGLSFNLCDLRNSKLRELCVMFPNKIIDKLGFVEQIYSNDTIA